MMSIYIREATKEDYPALLPIASESQAQHAEAHPDLFQQGVAGLPEDYFLGLLESEASCVYVAELEKSIVGYLSTPPLKRRGILIGSPSIGFPFGVQTLHSWAPAQVARPWAEPAWLPGHLSYDQTGQSFD